MTSKLKWNRTTGLCYPVEIIYSTTTKEFEIRKVTTAYGDEYRLYRKDPDAMGGFEWQQSFHRLWQAKDAANHVAFNYDVSEEPHICQHPDCNEECYVGTLTVEDHCWEHYQEYRYSNCQ